ncbi:MAG: phosphatase PAP2 family protein [Propionibacteriales bacterium]|nr:phosphatase PAP2 family protein [Propionibacteriales bacterium]
MRERWSLDHARFVVLGMGSWYLTYVSFRNLKSFVPFVNTGVDDDNFQRLDRAIFFGHDPAALLHDLLGTAAAAEVLSVIYIAWLPFIPFSIAAALVWTRHASAGAWYVTAMAVDWVLGAVTFYIFPTLGPVYSTPADFAALPTTATSQLQSSMVADRAEVLADPFATDAVQNIAAFASLHVGMTVTACLIAHLLGVRRSVRYALWAFLFLTVLATVYLGWHFFVDAIGGAVIGATAVWVAAAATGHRTRPGSLGRSGSAALGASVHRVVESEESPLRRRSASVPFAPTRGFGGKADERPWT